MKLSEWMCERKDHNLVAIKRMPRVGECYSDGTQIKEPVNAGWRDANTDEIYWMENERI